jgi:hypothetical protein
MVAAALMSVPHGVPGRQGERGEEEEEPVSAVLELVVLILHAIPLRTAEHADVHTAEKETHEKTARSRTHALRQLQRRLGSRETLFSGSNR